MRYRRVRLQDGSYAVAVWWEDQWFPLTAFEEELGEAARDLVALLAQGPEGEARLQDLLAQGREPEPCDPTPLLPFRPLTFRDFMLFEAHAIQATKGWLRRFAPTAYRVVNLYEAIFKKPHPKVRPSALWYQRPIYYMSNPLSFITEGETVPWPSYTRALDYELELGFVIVRPLRNATPEAAREAIGGFFVLNDFSARDVQAAEMRSGFGPVKAKNFATAMAAEVVSAWEVLPRWQELQGRVRINGTVVAEGRAAGPRYDITEAVAYASLGETLHPGEVMATGTFPGCCALESGHWPQPGDRVTLEIDGIGRLENVIGEPEGG